MRFVSVAHFGCESEKRWTSFPKKMTYVKFSGICMMSNIGKFRTEHGFNKDNFSPKGRIEFRHHFFLGSVCTDIAKFKTGHGFYKGNFSPKGLIEIRHHFCIPIWPQLRHLTFTNSGDFILTYFIIVLHIVTSSMFQDNLDSVIVSCHGRLEEWSSSKPVFASKVVPALRSFSFILTVISGHLLIFQL